MPSRLSSEKPYAEEAPMSQDFCEKARWALDWHGVAYNEISWAPGLHRVLLKHYGANASTLPVLLDDETIVQGSSAIIDWAENRAQARPEACAHKQKTWLRLRRLNGELMR